MNKQDQMRHVALREIGCLVAYMRGLGFVPAEVHHLLTTQRHGTGKRRGEQFTIALNPWSHRGVPFGGWTAEQCRKELGPSYAREPRLFREQFGDDETLLAKQNELIATWRNSFVV